MATLAASHGRVLVGAEAPGIFESRDGGETFSLLTTLAGQPGSEAWDDPANQPPGHLGISAIMPDADDASRFWTIVQGVGIFETDDGGTSWTPRNKGLRADWPRPHEEVGFCVHRLVRSPADPNRMYQQNHVGVHRSDDGGLSWTEITDGLPSEFGFAAATHPHDRDTFYVIPLDPGHARCMPEGRAAVWRTRDGGSTWRELTNGLPQDHAHLGVLRAAMAIDGYDVPGLYFGTSTGQLFASADEGESWTRSQTTCPRSGRSRSRPWTSDGRAAPTRNADGRSSAACRGASSSTRRTSPTRSRSSRSAGPACATGCATRAGPASAHPRVRRQGACRA